MAIGGQPAFAAVADDAGLEDQILDDEVLVALEDRPGRLVDEGIDILVGDGQLGGLGSLGGAGPFADRVAGRSGRRLEATGGDPGRALRPLRRAISSSSCWMRSC